MSLGQEDWNQAPEEGRRSTRGLGPVLSGLVAAVLVGLTLLVAVVLGIPLYSNAAGVLPLVEALHAKGLAMGTVLAFMMSVVALSLPEMILLRRVLKPRLLATFIGVVGVGILAVGFLFNAIL